MRKAKWSLAMVVSCALLLGSRSLQAVTARIDVEPGATVQVGQEVFVSGCGSTGDSLLGNGMVDGRFDWDFGDGFRFGDENTFGITATHFFMRPGTYTVTLTVTDAMLETDTASVVITVVGSEPLLAPWLTDDCILHLPFEQDLADHGTSGLSGQWQGGAGGFVQGITGQGADLTSGAYIEIEDPGGALSDLEQMTISVWAKKRAPEARGYLLSKDAPFNLYVGEEWSTVSAYIETDQGRARVWRSNLSYLDDTNWHQYAVTYDGSMIRLFVDGREMEQTDSQGNPRSPMPHSGRIVFSGNSLFVGAAPADPTFDGNIDELKIYNVALTQKDLFRNFELWHAPFHSRIAQYLHAQVPYLATLSPQTRLRISLTGDNGHDEVLLDKDHLAEEETVLLDTGSLAAGVYSLTASLLDGGGTVLDAIVEYFSKDRDGAPRIGINEHNAICIDGSPFFPVTSFILSTSRIKWWAAGRYINTLFSAGNYEEIDAWRDYLDAASEFGLPVIGQTSWPGRSGKLSDISGVVGHVTETRDHPSLFLWAWYDEPNLGSESYVPAPVIRSWTYKTHQNDSQHPVYFNLYGWDYLTEAPGPDARISEYDYLYDKFIFGTKVFPYDLVGFDIYPIEYQYHSLMVDPNRIFERWTLAIDNMVAWNYNLVPFMTFVETQDLHALDVEASPPDCVVGETCIAEWTGYLWTPGPTPEQVRMEAWLAVVHGMKGINWYHHHTPTPPENFAVMQEFTDHIGSLASIVLGPPSTWSLSDDADERGRRVDTMVREDDDFLWVFAVRVTELNESDPITVSFTLDGLDEGSEIVEPGSLAQSVSELLGDPDLASRTFELSLGEAPVEPGTVQIAGTIELERDPPERVTLYFYDDGSGALYNVDPSYAVSNSSGQVDYQTGAVTIDLGSTSYGENLVLPGQESLVVSYRPSRQDRIIAQNGGRFSDVFEPNAVRVYRITKPTGNPGSSRDESGCGCESTHRPFTCWLLMAFLALFFTLFRRAAR